MNLMASPPLRENPEPPRPNTHVFPVLLSLWKFPVLTRVVNKQLVGSWQEHGNTTEEPGQHGKHGNTTEEQGQHGKNGNTTEEPGQHGKHGNTTEEPGKHGKHGSTTEETGQQAKHRNTTEEPSQHGKHGNTTEEPGHQAKHRNTTEEPGQHGKHGSTTEEPGQQGKHGIPNAVITHAERKRAVGNKRADRDPQANDNTHTFRVMFANTLSTPPFPPPSFQWKSISKALFTWERFLYIAKARATFRFLYIAKARACLKCKVSDLSCH
uniref:Uncharacterized protein n=1 Tax=Esox lucius TaxID=8010 RepID=A0AAY5KH05_ESOLU